MSTSTTPKPPLWTAVCPHCGFIALMSWQSKGASTDDLRAYQLKGYTVAEVEPIPELWERIKSQRRHGERCLFNPAYDPFNETDIQSTMFDT